MTPPPSNETTAPEIDRERAAVTAAVLLELIESITPLVDAVIGHRNELVDGGFSEESAEEMAVNFHAALVDAIFGGPE